MLNCLNVFQTFSLWTQISDHCLVKFMLTFCVSYKKVEETVSSCTFNMTQDTCVTHKCNGRYVWDDNTIGDILIKLRSGDVKQQLYVLNNNIEQAITNDEIDSTVDSFTNLIESVSSSFYKKSKITLKENNRLEISNDIFNAECEYKYR